MMCLASKEMVEVVKKLLITWRSSDRKPAWDSDYEFGRWQRCLSTREGQIKLVSKQTNPLGILLIKMTNSPD